MFDHNLFAEDLSVTFVFDDESSPHEVKTMRRWMQLVDDLDDIKHYLISLPPWKRSTVATTIRLEWPLIGPLKDDIGPGWRKTSDSLEATSPWGTTLMVGPVGERLRVVRVQFPTNSWDSDLSIYGCLKRDLEWLCNELISPISEQPKTN